MKLGASLKSMAEQSKKKDAYSMVESGGEGKKKEKSAWERKKKSMDKRRLEKRRKNT